MTNLTQESRNVHVLSFKDTKSTKIALLSDLHWDNPKCNLEILTKHLEYCKKHLIPVHINGDLFCLMQGRGDNRRSKSDIRPEHNNARYLDSVINTAIEYFEPYKDILTVIGYGNHEKTIIKYQETDILQRFVDLFNHKTGSNIYTGGYGGWMIYKLQHNGANVSFLHKYFHGSGGGGIVTKGAINLTRATETYNGFDIFSMGHIHENSSRNDVIETIEHNPSTGYNVTHKNIHLTITGTYKEEYGDGASGWHVERGAPPKPVGGRILDLSFERKYENGVKRVIKHVDSYKFKGL
jgi:Icc-related predicted phosphoesterase